MTPPTSRLLLTELRDYLAWELADYSFPDPSGSRRDARVFLHDLPDGQEAETWPFVIVRWLEGEVANEDGATRLTDTVELVVGVYSPNDPAETGLLLAELLDAARRSIWKCRVLARRFEQVEPLKASAVEPGRQVHQYQLAAIRTVWSYVWPSREQAQLTEMENKWRRKCDTSILGQTAHSDCP